MGIVKRAFSKKKLPSSALLYILESLVPYTDANLKIAFTPTVFFNDLENIEKQKKWQKQISKQQTNPKFLAFQTIKNTFYQARAKKLIVIDDYGIPRLTLKAQKLIKPYTAEKLQKSALLMVTFDIPENERSKRRYLRTLLKELGFRMIQQSVWVSEHDHRKILKSEITANDLQKYVRVYECARMI